VSGLTGIYKVLLMLEKGAIVPTPTFQNANPRLQLETRGLEVSAMHPFSFLFFFLGRRIM
jgi:acyl transferase domain-containing protein